MNKSKYNKRNKPQSLPQYGWGSTIGGIAGGALGTLLGPFGTTIGAGLGRQLGNMIDGEENTQGNMPQMPQLNIDPVNTQDFYNPVKAYGGYMYPDGGSIQTIQLTPQEEIAYQKWKKTIPKNLQYEGDYDLRGFYKENPTWSASNQTVHMGDKFKLPNHPTFSNESMYYNYQTSPQGGSWKGSNFMPNDPLQSKFLYSNNPEVSTRINKLTFGGQTQPNAEVEGNEVIQYQPGMQPKAIGQGNMQQIASDMSVAKGPTHANGGVPVVAQPGSMVISDRLPAPNTKEYKSIANKVEQLGRKKGQLEKKIEKNPNDKIAKDTIGLVQKQIDTLIQQQEQMKAMNAESIMAKAYQKAYGGNIGLDPMFLKLWNTGSYAYGGKLPKYYIGGDTDDKIPYKEQNEFAPYAKKLPREQVLRNRIDIGIDPVPILQSEPGFLSDKINEAKLWGDSYQEKLRETYTDVPIREFYEFGAVDFDRATEDAGNVFYNKQKKWIDEVHYPYLENKYKTQPLRNNNIPTEEEMYPGITNEYRKNVQNIKLNPNGTMDWDNTLNARNKVNIPSQQANTGSLLDYSKPTNINNPSGQNMSKTNLTGSEEDLFKTTLPNRLPKRNLLNNFGNIGNNLQYAAQYIPDVMAMFTKKDKPIDPNMYMNTSRVTPAKYDTSAEEAAVIDARNQAMMLAKETSGGDAGMYANLGNVANTGAYKNLGQVYNKAQNINMQNKMAADQANAGIEGQNRQMALNVANMNQADAQAVESMRQAGMQGLSNKLANQYSQNKQFKLLESMFPHYKYNNDGSVTYNGKTYYGDEATGIVDNLKMYASKLGINWFGGK